jgi:peptidoglycan-N-acetylglucosamine deacetylase
MDKMPVILTFDVDVELIWRARDPDGFRNTVTKSLSQYEITSGIPRIMKILEKYGKLPASFFVPGEIAEEYPEIVKLIDRSGFEICNHGYSHIYPAKLPSGAAEREEYEKSNLILEKLTGKVPKGYRSPAWEFSDYTLDIIEDMGFEFDSNMMGSDCIEYLHVGERKSKIVEIPIAWVLDDAAYWLYSGRTQGKCMQPIDSVQNYWIKTFDVLYDEFLEEKKEGRNPDKAFVLTCHPQIIGRPANSTVLDNLLRHICEHTEIEFMSLSTVTKKFREEHE